LIRLGIEVTVFTGNISVRHHRKDTRHLSCLTDIQFFYSRSRMGTVQQLTNQHPGKLKIRTITGLASDDVFSPDCFNLLAD